MSEIVTSLSDSLLQQLQQERLVLLNTVDFESGAPTVQAVSWIYAESAEKIRFAVDGRSRIVSNVKSNPLVTLSFFADGALNAVSGRAVIAAESLDDVPFKLACIDVAVDSVRDAMFYGSRISVEPQYEKTYDKRAAEKLDQQVFSAMKKA